MNFKLLQMTNELLSRGKRVDFLLQSFFLFGSNSRFTEDFQSNSLKNQILGLFVCVVIYRIRG